MEVPLLSSDAKHIIMLLSRTFKAKYKVNLDVNILKKIVSEVIQKTIEDDLKARLKGLELSDMYLVLEELHSAIQKNAENKAREQSIQPKINTVRSKKDMQ